jgi:hypothetical protein
VSSADSPAQPPLATAAGDFEAAERPTAEAEAEAEAVPVAASASVAAAVAVSVSLAELSLSNTQSPLSIAHDSSSNAIALQREHDRRG